MIIKHFASLLIYVEDAATLGYKSNLLCVESGIFCRVSAILVKSISA
jgi:hypothetical protein